MSERYRPAGVNKEFAAIMARARETNRERERTDRACNVPVPRDCGPGVYLTEAISAIECGVRVHDWEVVAEGLAMLEDLKARYAIVLGSKKATQPQSTSV